MTTVQKILDEKTEAKIYTVPSTATVFDALQVMCEGNIGAVLVTEDEKIVGIFTERDYAKKGEIEGRAAANTPVREVMTEAMYTVTTDTSTDECMALMMQYHIRHLPVVENDTLVGIVSMRDVVAASLEERESKIKGLENFIQASGFKR